MVPTSTFHIYPTFSLASARLLSPITDVFAYFSPSPSTLPFSFHVIKKSLSFSFYHYYYYSTIALPTPPPPNRGYGIFVIVKYTVLMNSFVQYCSGIFSFHFSLMLNGRITEICMRPVTHQLIKVFPFIVDM